MIDVGHVDLAELAETRGNITLRGTKEKYGPCPKCGGTDRFHVRNYNGCDYFFCRGCHEMRGDAIEYLKHFEGLTFGEALAALGLKGDAPVRPARKPSPAKALTPIEVPAFDDPPSAAWQNTVAAFVDECAARLWSPAGVRRLDYLREQRGLSDATIHAFRLGLHWPTDALGVRLDGGLWAARGIVIPRYYGGELWAVNVRRSKIDYGRKDKSGEPDGKKLMLITGSKTQLFNGDVLADADDVSAVLVCAGEFDCMLAQQHAPAGVACITFGGESKGPTLEVEALVQGKPVSIAFDNDEPGNVGAAKWAALGQRVRVPSGKDITDYAKAGGDVGAWIAETTNVYSWQPPTDAAERIAQAKRWLAVFDDATQPGFVRAQAWARMNVCAGETLASDGRPWLALAQ